MASFECWILGVGMCLTAMWKGLPSQTMAFIDLGVDMLSIDSKRCNGAIHLLSGCALHEAG